MKPQPGDYLLVLRPLDRGQVNTPPRRLARLLKAALRCYGFRCVTVRDALHGLPPATEPDCSPGCQACEAELQ